MKELLPIGSVVLLKEATKSLMIVGTSQRDEEGRELLRLFGMPFEK